MKAFVILFAAGLAAAPAAAASFAPTACVRGDDLRIIEVAAPGEIGRACDLRHVRDGGASLSIPYHAETGVADCVEQARLLVTSLLHEGFACEAQRSAAASASAPRLVQPSEVELGAPKRREREQAARAPVALSTAAAAAPSRSASNITGHGRIIGAAPDAVPASAVRVAAEERLTAAPPSMRGNEPEDRFAALDFDLPEAVAPARPSEDTIKAVLRAQAAAWNEGDLDGFMNAYWKSPALRFVSGSTVTTGWNEAMRRYRARYGEGASLGRLSLDALDVQMASEDVAVVFGRYRLLRDAGAEGGAFTLVMKRFDGLWRIIHDHSVGDPSVDQ